MFRNLLVPTDGSTLSNRAIKVAVRLAKEQKARITGFYVGPAWNPALVGDYVPPDFVSPQKHAASVKKAAERHLAAIQKAAKAAKVPCKVQHTMSDSPYSEIIRAARRNRCDLIVMASHGRSGVSRLLLGSQTSKVLAHTTIPVLVVR
jgi:nucleotide-binding universal stress UspA family protein